MKKELIQPGLIVNFDIKASSSTECKTKDSVVFTGYAEAHKTPAGAYADCAIE